MEGGGGRLPLPPGWHAPAWVCMCVVLGVDLRVRVCMCVYDDDDVCVCMYKFARSGRTN